MKPREWFRVEMKAGEEIADMYIYDNIGKSFWNDDAVSAKQFVDDLNALPATVTGVRVHVNSLGGDMFDGIAIANALRDYRKKGKSVETISEAVAASAASIVMMAGSPIVMGDNATMMIHLPWGFVIGNADDMRKTAEVFDGFSEQAVATYRWNTSLSAEDVLAMLKAETWLSADQAIEKGFATKKAEGLKAAASLDRRSLASLKVPDQYKPQVEALLKPEPKPDPKPEPMAALEVVRACKVADCADLAEELMATGATPAQVTATIETTKAARSAAKVRATEITAICEASKRPEMAATMIASGLDVAGVKAHLANVRAAVDEARGHLDTSIDPDHGQPANIRASWKSAHARSGRKFGVKAS